MSSFVVPLANISNEATASLIIQKYVSTLSHHDVVVVVRFQTCHTMLIQKLEHCLQAQWFFFCPNHRLRASRGYFLTLAFPNFPPGVDTQK